MKQEKMRLYLDDVRTPIAKDWVVVRTYDEFVSKIRLFGLDKFELISLDHDLGEQAMIEYYTNVKKTSVINYENIINERTGYDAAKFLVSESMSKGIPLPIIHIHSANPVGSGNIYGYIMNYLKNTKMPGACMVAVSVPHTIDETLHMSPEARKARWDRNVED